MSYIWGNSYEDPVVRLAQIEQTDSNKLKLVALAKRNGLAYSPHARFHSSMLSLGKLMAAEANLVSSNTAWQVTATKDRETAS